jgi:hypothetical protein
MARRRFVSPEFFQHGDLYDAELASGLPLRLAFAGLWTQCDRRGVFTYKPRELKLAILPYDTIDFAAVLKALEAAGFVIRYDVDGRQYGVIPSFSRWQSFHRDERPSDAPPPPDPLPTRVLARHEHSASTVPARCQHGADTVPARCEHGADTVLTPLSHSASTPITTTTTTTTTTLPMPDDATSASSGGRTRSRRTKPPAPVKWPDWPQATRQKMHDRWRARLGDVPYPQWVAALGPVFGNPPDPWTFSQLATAYDSWLSSVGSGGASSPYLRRNPAGCASVLSAIAAINESVHPDDPERLAAIDRLVHGRAA